MPRKRDTSIGEELEQLNRLEREYRGKPEAARIKMLQLIKQQPALSITEIAVLVGYSVPTIKRWLKLYRSSGLDALLQMTAAGKQTKSNQGLDLLRQKLVEGDFQSLSDVRRWMEHYHSSLGDKEYARQLMVGSAADREDTTAEIAAAESIIPNNILQFLTKLPTAHTVQEWVHGFRAAFQELLGDVDRITMMVNVQCPLAEPEAYNPSIAIVDEVDEGKRLFVPIPDDNTGDKIEELARLLATLRRQKFPFENYHVPKSFVYHYEGAYLGVMILWRERNHEPISQCTLSIVESLRPFLVFLFSDLAARHQSVQPFDRIFQTVFEDKVTHTALTFQERRVVTLQLLGCSYDEIAESLHISVNTVRSHIKAISEKTGGYGRTHILAKYFKPMTAPTMGEK